MAAKSNEFHLIAFDPGGTIGWAHLVLDFKAFSRPDHRALRYLKSWDCGEFSGAEETQIADCIALIGSARYGAMPYVSKTDVISEDFELTQLIGGKELLSPVRINAVLNWVCITQFSLILKLQNRQMRKGITKERLKLFGFEGRFRKDEFAAMQHAITWLRIIKSKADIHPWKLENGVSTNAYWDCACEKGKRCDMTHSKQK